MATSPRKPTAKSGSAPSATTLRQERQRLALLLHNTVCQELTGAFFLAGAEAQKHGGDYTEAGRKFSEIADLIQRAGAGLAEIVHDLNHSDEA